MGSYYFLTALLTKKSGGYHCIQAYFYWHPLYVKSMMRERKIPLYLKASIIFHVLYVLGCLFTQQYVLSFAFVPALIRAIYLPTKETFG